MSFNYNVKLSHVTVKPCCDVVCVTDLKYNIYGRFNIVNVNIQGMGRVTLKVWSVYYSDDKILQFCKFVVLFVVFLISFNNKKFAIFEVFDRDDFLKIWTQFWVALKRLKHWTLQDGYICQFTDLKSQSYIFGVK